jgi:hypothetical protein
MWEDKKRKLAGQPAGKGQLWIFTCKWEDIKINLKETWCEVQNTYLWTVLVNTINEYFILSLRGRQFLDQLSKYQFLTKGSAVWSYYIQYYH